MTVKVSGAIFLTNGIMPEINYYHQNNFNTSTEVGGVPQSVITCKLQITRGQIKIELANVDDEEQWKNIQSMCKGAIELFLAINLLKTGTGLMWYCIQRPQTLLCFCRY